MSNQLMNVTVTCTTTNSTVTSACCSQLNGSPVNNTIVAQLSCVFGGQLAYSAVNTSMTAWDNCTTAHGLISGGCDWSDSAPAGNFGASAGMNNARKAVLGLFFVGAIIQAITMV
ncbi:hypothetical protein BJ138DRAFT_1103554 [Hygrophoropsis aurantiaca]|uniref:Uncharacterized protein n=1 Tax=Hygrophoropsis aurantiaca TaxID=72124 RepID=A0ACB8A5K4_9AGAM|nr:hypothetical protein BJ138DRAFT_1103554 [Hygrophoropsis aurantiaca]